MSKLSKLITELGGLWNPWYLLNTSVQVENQNSIAIPHASIPTSYLPSKAFRTQSFASHCYLEEDLCLPIGTGLNNVFIGRTPSLASIDILTAQIDELIGGLGETTAELVRVWVRGVFRRIRLWRDFSGTPDPSIGKPEGENDAENAIINQIEEILSKIIVIKQYYITWTPPDNIYESESSVSDSESSLSDLSEEIIDEPDHFTYKCRWDAENNSPRLVNGVGKIRNVYLVSNDGSQDFGDGSISFVAGDFVMYDYDESENESEEDGKWRKVPLWDASTNIPQLRHGFVDYGYRAYIVSEDGIQNLNPQDSSTSSSSNSEFGDGGYDGGQRPQPFFKGDWVFYNGEYWENTRFTSSIRHRFNIEWGIDGQYPNAPELGYCVGDAYCELIYARSVFSGKYNGNAAFGGIMHNSYMDVFQRAKAKRMYIHHGSVVQYSEITEGDDSEAEVTYILQLDIDDNIINYQDLSEASITIVKNGSGTSFEITIVEVLEDLRFVIDAPTESIDSGDFYLFNTCYCIRDPYLLTGFYVGTENTSNDKKTLLEDEEGYADDYGGENPKGFKPPNYSGFDLHITTKNIFFDDVVFTGAFVFKDESGNVIINDSDTLFDEGEAKWHWIPIETTEQSEIYQNSSVRYSESVNLNRGTWRIAVEDESNSEDSSGVIDEDFSTEEDLSSDYVEQTGVLVKFNTSPQSIRPQGSTADISSLISLGAKSIRLEINHSGDHLRNNWHAPILSKNYFNQGGKYFKIFKQPDGNVIDVSLKDITNATNLDLYAEGSIFNHYGWFISEHFAVKSNNAFFGGDYSSAIGTLTIPATENSSDDDLSSESGDDNIEILGVYGIFGGKIDSVEDAGEAPDPNPDDSEDEPIPLKKIIIKTHGESKGTISRNTTYYNPSILNEVNSFYNRFRIDYYEGTPVRLWEKYDGWRLVREDLRRGAKIVDIVFPSEFPEEDWIESEIEVTIEADNWQDYNIGQTCWFVFDTPYVPNTEDPKYVTGDLHTLYDFIPKVEEEESSVEEESSYEIPPPETPPDESQSEVEEQSEEYSSESSEISSSSTGESSSSSSSSGTTSSESDLLDENSESQGDGGSESGDGGGGGGEFSFDYESSSEPYCLEMNYINLPIKEKTPSAVIVGVCGGRWWGVFDIYDFEFTRSNNGLPLFISTQSFVPPGMTSFYNGFAQQDWVIYFDSFTEKMTARVGQLGFIAQPRKIEISCGLSTRQVSSFPISPNTNYDRVKSIEMDIEIGSTVSFFLGEENNYHGFIINGKGIVNLPFFTSENEAENFKFESNYSSPVYLDSKYNPSSRKILNLGMSTGYGKVYANGVTPNNVTVHYVGCNQTFESNAQISAHNLNDGEKIIVFSRQVDTFSIDGIEYDTSTWDNKNCIFIVGTSDNGNEWFCPNIKKTKLTWDGKYQWALMVLNATSFLCSIYNKISQTLIVICKSKDEGGRVYLGAFLMSLPSLIYKTVLCSGSIEFLWRPPLLDGNPWTNDSNVISVAVGEVAFKDRFVRIIGGLATDSQIEDGSVDFFKGVSGVFSPDGVIRLFYISRGTVRMLFSTSNGIVWQKSAIRFAYSSNSALCIENYLFYISSGEGIRMKYIGGKHWNGAYYATEMEGVDEAFIELVQSEVNALKTVLIYNGEIKQQQLSGYRDTQGVYYIFYYDNEGNLSSLSSANAEKWSGTPNF